MKTFSKIFRSNFDLILFSDFICNVCLGHLCARVRAHQCFLTVQTINFFFFLMTPCNYFCFSMNWFQAGKNIDKWLYDLGANRLMPVGLLDENVAASKHGGIFMLFFLQGYFVNVGPVTTLACPVSAWESCSNPEYVMSVVIFLPNARSVICL